MRGRRHLALSLLSTSADTSERCPHTHTYRLRSFKSEDRGSANWDGKQGLLVDVLTPCALSAVVFLCVFVLFFFPREKPCNWETTPF